MKRRVTAVSFQIGASFKGQETICLLWTDGSIEYYPLTSGFAQDLRFKGLKNILAIEG